MTRRALTEHDLLPQCPREESDDVAIKAPLERGAVEPGLLAQIPGTRVASRAEHGDKKS